MFISLAHPFFDEKTKSFKKPVVDLFVVVNKEIISYTKMLYNQIISLYFSFYLPQSLKLGTEQEKIAFFLINQT